MDRDQEKRASALSPLEPMSPSDLLRSPLDFLFAEHSRQRVTCGILDEIAEDETIDTEKVGAVLDFLTDSLRLHVRDEDEDLFPLLRRHAEADDRLGELLSELSEEHVVDGACAEAIIEELLHLETAAPSTEFRKLVRRFAANGRRHLITENAIVMPMTRALLTHRDLKDLGHNMAARRGWTFPEGGSHK